MISWQDRPYFFDDGLCFQCTRCGACCTGDPGTIYVGPDEIASIARLLGLSTERFVSAYLYPYKDSYSIREDAGGRCLFFDDGCTIYDHRPLQCRTFPFWFSYLRSESRWRELQHQCPGIGRGRRYAKDEIVALVSRTLHL